MRCLIRRKLADLQRLVDNVNRRFAYGGKYDLDSAYGKRRLVWLTPAGGERNISPLLSTGVFYDWIDAFLEGLDRSGAEKMYAALAVITFSPKIKEWLSENDPKALEQCQDAMK